MHLHRILESADHKVVSNLASGNQVGDAVTVLWTDGSETRVGFGEVASEVPFAVALDGERAPSETMEVRLVRDQGERWVAGTATVRSIEDGFLVLRNVDWEEPSQRVYPRHTVDWPVTLRILDDGGTRETFQVGMAVDVSVGGAGVRLDEPPEVGSLVEFRAIPRGEKPLRAVAVVVRKEEEGIGLAFLFVWGGARIGASIGAFAPNPNSLSHEVEVLEAPAERTRLAA